MTRSIRVKSGNAEVTLDDTATAIFTDVLNKAAPETIRILERTVEDIYTDAYALWPVRKDTKVPETPRQRVRAMSRTLERSGYDRKRAYAAALRMESDGDINIQEIQSSKSQDSKNKLEFGLRIIGDQIEAFVGNTATYAWAIKVGVDTDLPYARGTRVANELLWKPARKKTDRVVETTANELAEIIRRS